MSTANAFPIERRRGTRFGAAACAVAVLVVACGSAEHPTEFAPPPTAVALVDSIPAVTSVGQAISVHVRVTTAAGTPSGGVIVRFAVLEGGGSVSPSSVATGAAGEAFGTWIAGSIGAGKLMVAPASVTPLIVSSTPVAVGPAVGVAFSCAIAQTGTASCWGNNDAAQLGDGTTTTRSTPVRVLGVPTLQRLFAGYARACGIAVNGDTYCWGENTHGGVGDGTALNVRPTPKPISGSLRFTKVSAGVYHTCGITPEKDAYCWGWNYAGLLGEGDTVERYLPTAVSGYISFSDIAAGFTSTCGISTAGDGYCWGALFGTTGDGFDGSYTTPHRVAGGLSFSSIVAGTRHFCALTTAGVPYCWGLNDKYQIGDGTTTQRNAPTPVSGSLTLVSLTADEYHTCGLTSNGHAYCWGLNSTGQLGDGTTETRSAPVAAAPSMTFLSIAAGGGHTCGLETTGRLYCWGGNGSGQIGDGTTIQRLAPTLIPLP